jgi:hypothetical protein
MGLAHERHACIYKVHEHTHAQQHQADAQPELLQYTSSEQNWGFVLEAEQKQKNEARTGDTDAAATAQRSTCTQSVQVTALLKAKTNPYPSPHVWQQAGRLRHTPGMQV